MGMSERDDELLEIEDDDKNRDGVRERSTHTHRERG